MRLRERVLITIALAALSAGALWLDRSIQFFIGRDSSLFLYVAQRIQEGGLPIATCGTTSRRSSTTSA